MHADGSGVQNYAPSHSRARRTLTRLPQDEGRIGATTRAATMCRTRLPAPWGPVGHFSRADPGQSHER